MNKEINIGWASVNIEFEFSANTMNFNIEERQPAIPFHSETDTFLQTIQLIQKAVQGRMIWPKTEVIVNIAIPWNTIRKDSRESVFFKTFH